MGCKLLYTLSILIYIFILYCQTNIATTVYDRNRSSIALPSYFIVSFLKTERSKSFIFIIIIAASHSKQTHDKKNRVDKFIHHGYVLLFLYRKFQLLKSLLIDIGKDERVTEFFVRLHGLGDMGKLTFRNDLLEHRTG